LFGQRVGPASLDANSAIWDNLGFEQRLPIHALIHHVGYGATMSNLMVSGILDKYPNIKVGLIESGSGWVPFWLEAMEHQLDERIFNWCPREESNLSCKPLMPLA
jgi:uncharacterized protein